MAVQIPVTIIGKMKLSPLATSRIFSSWLSVNGLRKFHSIIVCFRRNSAIFLGFCKFQKHFFVHLREVRNFWICCFYEIHKPPESGHAGIGVLFAQFRFPRNIFPAVDEIAQCHFGDGISGLLFVYSLPLIFQGEAWINFCKLF